MFALKIRNNVLLAIILISISLVGSVKSVGAQEVFERRIYPDSRYWINSSTVSPDSCVISSGWAEDSTSDMIVQKTDINGGARWIYRYHISNAQMQGQSVMVLPSGDIRISASVRLTPTLSFPILLALDREGTIQWCKEYRLGFGVTMGSGCVFRNNTIVLTGAIALNPDAITRASGLALNIDSTGTPLWCYSYHRSQQSNWQTFYTAAINKADSAVVLSGYSAFDSAGRNTFHVFELMQLRPNGIPNYYTTYNFHDLFFQKVNIVATRNNGAVAAADVGSTNTLSTIGLAQVNEVCQFGWAVKIALLSVARLVTTTASFTSGILAVSTSNNHLRDSLWHIISIDKDGHIPTVIELKNRAEPLTICPIDIVPPRYQVISLFDHPTTPYIAISSFTSALEGCDSRETLCIFDTISCSIDTSNVLYDVAAIQTVPLSLLRAPIQWKEETICEESREVTSSLGTSVLAIYPNPAEGGVIRVKTPSNITGASVVIILRDLTGREVYRTHREAATPGEQIQIPTAGLASGVYTVELLDANSFANVWRGKVVVE